MKRLVFFSLIGLLVFFTSCSEGLTDLVNPDNDTTVDVNDLPTAITSYISSTYPSLTIVAAEMEEDDQGNIIYEVELSDGTELYFDSEGNLVDDDDDDDDDENDIPLDSLPLSVQQYISTNYSAYTFDGAEMEELFGDSTQMVYEVDLYQGNSEISLYFDMSGNFIQEEVEIMSSALPSAVSSAITSQYGSYQLDDEADQYNRANGDIWYGVELEDNTQELEVIFDAMGTVLYEIMD